VLLAYRPAPVTRWRAYANLGLILRPLGVKSAVLTIVRSLPVYPQLQTSRCTALTVAMGQLRTLPMFGGSLRPDVCSLDAGGAFDTGRIFIKLQHRNPARGVFC
jgi:hypothetical protein